MPGDADLVVRVAGLEQGGELRSGTVVESFVALGEQPPGPVERVFFGPRLPSVSFWTRRASLSFELAWFTTWNGSATWVTWPRLSLNTLRYGRDMSNTP